MFTSPEVNIFNYKSQNTDSISRKAPTESKIIVEFRNAR